MGGEKALAGAERECSPASERRGIFEPSAGYLSDLLRASLLVCNAKMPELRKQSTHRQLTPRGGLRGQGEGRGGRPSAGCSSSKDPAHTRVFQCRTLLRRAAAAQDIALVRCARALLEDEGLLQLSWMASLRTPPRFSERFQPPAMREASVAAGLRVRLLALASKTNLSVLVQTAVEMQQNILEQHLAVNALVRRTLVGLCGKSAG